MMLMWCVFFFSSRRRHTRWNCDWSSDVCSSDLDVDRGTQEGPGGSRPQRQADSEAAQPPARRAEPAVRGQSGGRAPPAGEGDHEGTVTATGKHGELLAAAEPGRKAASRGPGHQAGVAVRRGPAVEQIEEPGVTRSGESPAGMPHVITSPRT